MYGISLWGAMSLTDAKRIDGIRIRASRLALGIAKTEKKKKDDIWKEINWHDTSTTHDMAMVHNNLLKSMPDSDFHFLTDDRTEIQIKSLDVSTTKSNI